MHNQSTWLALSLGLLAAACSEPQCPCDSIRHGDTCTACEPGTAPVRNVCVALAGDASVSPINTMDEDDSVNSSSQPELDGTLSPIARWWNGQSHAGRRQYARLRPARMQRDV